MNKVFIAGLIVLVQLVNAQTLDPSGRWDGAIELPGSPLDISVTLRRNEVWVGTIDIPAQDATGVPLENVQLNGASVRFAIADIPGEPTFEGTLSSDMLEGTFSQSGEAFPFTLTRQVALSEAERVTAVRRGRTLSRWFYERDFGRLYGAFSDPYKTSTSREQLEAFRQQVEEQAGAETSVQNETVSRRGGLLVYTRTALFDKFGATADVTWGLDARGEVALFSVTPQEQNAVAPSKRLSYETKTALQLPFGGFWSVFWGGRTLAENYHAAYPDQRFAYDFVVERGGSSHRGNGTQLSDYYCFGRPVYAPGAGVIVEAVSSLPDQAIGASDAENALGNYVVIDHQNGEFSFLAHLRQGSVTVAPGETVAAGEPIGRCGNSGNTSEPHLHYHMQTDAVFHGAAGGEGLPAQFLNYTADGKRVARGEPVRGQTVER